MRGLQGLVARHPHPDVPPCRHLGRQGASCYRAMLSKGPISSGNLPVTTSTLLTKDSPLRNLQPAPEAPHSIA